MVVESSFTGPGFCLLGRMFIHWWKVNLLHGVVFGNKYTVSNIQPSKI